MRPRGKAVLLERAEGALAALDARLRLTGSRLFHAGANRYRLGPALSALSRHDRQRIARRECHREGLPPDDAGVLRLIIIEGSADKRNWADPACQTIVDRLVDAGLVNDRGDHYEASAEVSFSLRLDEAPY